MNYLQENYPSNYYFLNEVFFRLTSKVLMQETLGKSATEEIN